jgi:hypothetical protein
MTREECLLKLLSIEPETQDRLIQITGWPADETVAVLQKLVREHRVGYGNGPYGCHGRRPYFARELRHG